MQHFKHQKPLIKKSASLQTAILKDTMLENLVLANPFKLASLKCGLHVIVVEAIQVCTSFGGSQLTLIIFFVLPPIRFTIL